MKPLQKHHSPGAQVLPLGERKAAWGEEDWAESRWANIAQGKPTREAGGGG